MKIGRKNLCGKSDSNRLSYGQHASLPWTTWFGRGDWSWQVEHKSCREVQNASWRWLSVIPPCPRENDTSPHRLMCIPPGSSDTPSTRMVGKRELQTCRSSGPSRAVLKHRSSFMLCAFSRFPSVQSTSSTCHLGFETELTTERLKWSWRLLTQSSEGRAAVLVKGHRAPCLVFWLCLLSVCDVGK